MSVRTDAVKALRGGPTVAILYVLIYWGRTLFAVSIILNVVLALLHQRTLALICAALGVAAAFFNLGIFVGGTLGVPPGRRR